jgi:hypothetical protein
MSTAGLPYTLELRPGSSDELAGLAASRAMTRNQELPLMALGQNADSLAVRPPAEPAIRKIAPDQASVHAHIAPQVSAVLRTYSCGWWVRTS